MSLIVSEPEKSFPNNASTIANADITASIQIGGFRALRERLADGKLTRSSELNFAPPSLNMAKLYFYYSAMNAGKSTTLLQAAHNYEERGMQVLLYTPIIDDRQGVGIISSRIGLSREAIAFERDFDLFVDIQSRMEQQGVNCIFIDEAQFLSPAQVLQLTLVCDHLKIPVLCYGLRTDFVGEPFEGSKYLLSWADELGEIKTICHSGKKATMNARLDSEGQRVSQGDQVSIGHHYVALSRREFELDQVSPVGYSMPSSKPSSKPDSQPQNESSLEEQPAEAMDG